MLNQENALELSQGGFARVTLDQIAHADEVRLNQIARSKQTTRRRRGHKGTRVWGYTVPGKGKRR